MAQRRMRGRGKDGGTGSRVTLTPGAVRSDPREESDYPLLRNASLLKDYP